MTDSIVKMKHPRRHFLYIAAGAVALLVDHRSGKLRILAVTSSTRLIAAAELPTAAELAFAGMTVRGSIGLPTMPSGHQSSRHSA
jgi:tripartite-type tricarboxylate transporter receptor subunit TctC